MRRLLYILAACFLGSCSSGGGYDFDKVKPKSAAVNVLPIPSQHIAGSALALKGDFVLGTDMLVVNNKYGAQKWPLETSKHLMVPDSLFEVSGAYQILLFRGSRLKARALMEVKAGAAINKIEHFIGPKAITAGAGEEGMLVYIPRDELGNPTANVSAFSNRQESTTRIKEEQLVVRNLYAYSIIENQTKSEKIFVGTKSESANTLPAELFVAPAPLNSMQLEVSRLNPIADGRSYFRLHCFEAKDAFGNVINDGTPLFVKLFDEGEMTASYQVGVLNGEAYVEIRNPKKAGVISLQVEDELGFVSKSLSLSFKSAISSYDISYKNNALLRVGPVLALKGEYIDDGTSVDFYFAGKRSFKYKAEIRNGYAELDLNKLELPAGKYLLESCVLGVTELYNLERNEY